VPDPLGGRMYDRILGIELMHREIGGHRSIVGWIEGPLALAQEDVTITGHAIEVRNSGATVSSS